MVANELRLELGAKQSKQRQGEQQKSTGSKLTRRVGKGSNNKGISGKKFEGVNFVKSPLDTTLYAPALCNLGTQGVEGLSKNSPI